MICELAGQSQSPVSVYRRVRRVRVRKSQSSWLGEFVLSQSWSLVLSLLILFGSGPFAGASFDVLMWVDKVIPPFLRGFASRML